MTIHHCDCCVTPCHAQTRTSRVPIECWLDGRIGRGSREGAVEKARRWGITDPTEDDELIYFKCSKCPDGPCYLWGDRRWRKPEVCLYDPGVRIQSTVVKIDASDVPPDVQGRYEMIE